MPVPILAGITAAGAAAAMGKGAATVGLSAAGEVASYYIVDAARAKHDPMIVCWQSISEAQNQAWYSLLCY